MSSPDEIARRALDAGWLVKTEPMAPWEDRTELDLFEELLRRSKVVVSDLVLVTEASWTVGAFRFPISNLERVIERHHALYEALFNGDFLLIQLAPRRVSCVHHENAFITIAPSVTN
ncbi:MAG: hypothetical protein R3F14_00030 [Polyangiaceae bacterium]